MAIIWNLNFQNSTRKQQADPMTSETVTELTEHNKLFSFLLRIFVTTLYLNFRSCKIISQESSFNSSVWFVWFRHACTCLIWLEQSRKNNNINNNNNNKKRNNNNTTQTTEDGFNVGTTNICFQSFLCIYTYLDYLDTINRYWGEIQLHRNDIDCVPY